MQCADSFPILMSWAFAIDADMACFCPAVALHAPTWYYSVGNHGLKTGKVLYLNQVSREGYTQMKKLNIGIVAHVDAGKTTLTENILHLGGAIPRVGRVDKGDTQTDSMEIERKRGISVRAAVASFFHNQVKFNLIDTPGHVDFVAEVERSLMVLDGVVLVISAVEGLQSHTKLLMDIIMGLGIPTVIFINKIDRLGANPDKVASLANTYLHERLIITERIDSDGGIVLLSDREFVEYNSEALYNVDDALMEKFVNNETNETISLNPENFYYHTRRGRLYPVFFGSALHGVGVDKMLSKLPLFLPLSHADCGEALSALVFKIENTARDRHVYVRLYRGKLKVREMVRYREREEKIVRLGRLEGSKIIAADSVEAGDVGVLYSKDMRVGDVLGEDFKDMRKVNLGRPTINVEVQPVCSSQRRQLYEALVQLTDEDPMLELSSGKGLNLHIFGEIQMEILRELLAERYGITSCFSQARTIYMECPTAATEIIAPLNRNGTPFRAGVGFRIEPLPQGSGLFYETKVSFGELEKTFQTAVEEAVFETCKRGTYGWEITDTKVTFIYADYDSVTSTPSAFRDLTPPILMEAFSVAEMGLLEPVLAYELHTPTLFSGTAIYDLRRMNATIDETLQNKDDIVITGLIPSDSCKGYGAKVASYTQGLGIFTTKYHSYQKTDITPEKINTEEINLATNKSLYLLHKFGAR